VEKGCSAHHLDEIRNPEMISEKKKRREDEEYGQELSMKKETEDNITPKSWRSTRSDRRRGNERNIGPSIKPAD